MQERGRATRIIQPLARHTGRVVVALLIGSLLATFAFMGLVAAADFPADPVRTLPASVTPGQEFEVTVTFHAPAADFNSIGLKDLAPAGWAVSLDACNPVEDFTHIPDPSTVEYTWVGFDWLTFSSLYNEGDAFTAKYKVQVPADAAPGMYTFPDGTLEYYIGADNYTELIGGAGIQVLAATPGPLILPTIAYDILVLQSTEGGTVAKPSGAVTAYYSSWICYYLPGTVVNLTAIPDPGYRFVNWTGTVDTMADVDAASATITMNGDYGIVANFARIEEQHSLTISSSSGGTVTAPGEGTFTYEAGTVVSLAAKAGPGYRFVNWAGDVTTLANANAAATAIAMDGDYSIVANFAEIPPDQVTLTVSSSAVGPIIITPIIVGGSVTTPGGATFTYDKGTVVDLKAEPDWGWQFAKWTGDTGTVADVNAASTTITMNDDYSVTATFKFGTGCFIATAAYGTPMAEDVQTLRDFRDEYLATNPVGSTLVDLYYAVSPPIADFITEHPGLKSIVRAGLAPAVAMSTVAVNTSRAEKAAMLGLLLVSVALAIWATRRRAQT
jgi:hypothetical protein